MSGDDTTTKEQTARAKDMARESRLSFRKYAEHRLRQDLKDIAIEKCKPEIRSFAECAEHKGLLVVLSCRDHHRKVQECLSIHNSEEEWQKYKAEHQDEIEFRATGRRLPGK